MANQQLNVLESCTAELINHLEANDPTSIADKLFSSGLLPWDVYNRSIGCITTNDKARIITTALTSKVKAQPKDYEKILTVFRNKGLNDMADILEEKLRKLVCFLFFLTRLRAESSIHHENNHFVLSNLKSLSYFI